LNGVRRWRLSLRQGARYDASTGDHVSDDRREIVSVDRDLTTANI
jgi:hypothetical protein